MRRRAIPGALVFAACSGPASMDAGHDAAVLDAGRDAGADAGTDAGSDAGYDAGYDAGTQDAGAHDAGPVDPCENATMSTDDAGLTDAGGRCGCVLGALRPDGGIGYFFYCDSDPGNPCPLCCFNPREPDGGRRYDANGPVCFC